MTASAKLRLEPRFGDLIDHLHVLGPSPVGELLLELAYRYRVERYGDLDPAVVATVEVRRWRPLLPHEVA